MKAALLSAQTDILFTVTVLCNFTSEYYWKFNSGHFVDPCRSILLNICSQNNDHCTDRLGAYPQPCNEFLMIQYAFANDVSNTDLQAILPWVT
jgi:hypothetical protein